MKFFSQNLGAKLLALVCAVFLWVYVSASESKVEYFPGSIPIEVKNTPSGLAAIYDEQKVRVKLQAPYQVYNRLSIDNFEAFLDLSGLSEGTYEVEVGVVVNVANVVIVEKEPAKVIVRLEAVTQKEVPVVVKFEGEAKSGYVPGEPVIKPDKAEAKGAKSLVESLSEAVALVKLSGEDEDFKRTVALFVYNEKGEKQKGIEFTPTSVQVEIPIVAASENKTVGIKAKIKGRPKSDYFVSKIETTPTVVEVSGSDSALKGILYIETKEIDIEGIDKDLEKEVELSAPVGITLKDKKVRVKISLSLNTTSREIVASFSYANLTAGLSVNSVTPNTVKVVVSGPVSTINELSSSNIVITFNLQGKAAGSHFIDITKDMISLPEGCAASSWLPSAVTIILQ